MTNIHRLILIPAVLLAYARCSSAQNYRPPRCEIVPLADHQVSFRIDGEEKLCWHFGDQYPRPFFFPFNGPSGQTLTRMGHPGAQNHDHHRSVWFAHHKVDGIDFWSDNAGTKIRQTHWYRYRDGNNEAVMACHLSWVDDQEIERMTQDVVVALMPVSTPDDASGQRSKDEHAVEFQLTFRPGKNRDQVVLQQTNFGVLAVRVAKSLSGYFGGGRLTNPDGTIGEKRLHERRAKWMDYSGPITVPTAGGRKVVEEGITYFDHPDNPSHPTFWHVREDGWMGAAPGMKAEFTITDDSPLVLRYLLHCHHGPIDQEHAETVYAQFCQRTGFRIRKPIKGEPHRQYEVERRKNDSDSE